MKIKNQNFRGVISVSFLVILALGFSSCKKNTEQIDKETEAARSRSAAENLNGVSALTATVYYLAANSNSVAFQNLVNGAVSGDVIILRTGSHYVTTPIRFPAGKNNITVRGETGAVIRKAPNSYSAAAIEITGNGNVFDLIELDGGNLPEAGIIIYGQSNKISNSKIHNCGNATKVGAGILLHNLGTPVCALNTVIGCSVYYNYMVGVSQNGHSDGLIRDNLIYENGAEGLTIDVLSHNNRVINNTINKNNKSNRGVGGIGIDYSNGNRIDNNTISNTYYRSGITFQNNIGKCDGTVVINNHLTNNAGYGIFQRFTQYANTNSGITGNVYSGNALGTIYTQY
jgi:hypothetical protein